MFGAVLLCALFIAACGGTANGVARPVNAPKVASDLLELVPASYATVVRMWPAEFQEREYQVMLAHGLRSFDALLPQRVITHFMELDEVLVAAPSDGGTEASIVIVRGPIDTWREELGTEVAWDARGAWIYPPAADEPVHALVLDSRHAVFVARDRLDVFFDTLARPAGSFAHRDAVPQLVASTRFRTTSAAVLLVPFGPDLDRMAQSASEDMQVGLEMMRQLHGAVLELQVGDEVAFTGIVRTRTPEMAAQIEQVGQAALEGFAGTVPSPWTEVKLERRGADITLAWSGAAERITTALQQAQSTDDPAANPAATAEAAGELKEMLELNPGDQQVRADLGWLLVRSGDIEAGVRELRSAPLPPSDRCLMLFPRAADPAERRALYLRTLDALSAPLDGRSLVVAHIFVDHLTCSSNSDPELIGELEQRAQRSDAAAYLDALRAQLYGAKRHAERLAPAERVIAEIEARRFAFEDSEHHGHFYYNAACALAQARQDDLAQKRLGRAFQLAPGLYELSLRDDDLKAFRARIGEAAFERLRAP